MAPLLGNFANGDTTMTKVMTKEDIEVLANWMRAFDDDMATASDNPKMSEFLEAVQNETKIPDIQEMLDEIEEIENILTQTQYRLKTIKEIVIEMK
jgi:ferritin